MLPGISGSLIAPSFLESALDHVELRAAADVQRLRQLHGWWQRVVHDLGPASSPRAIADAAAMPLFEALGYEVARLEPHDEGFVGLIGRDGQEVAVRVTAWGSDPRLQWRDTVRLGRIAGTEWGIVLTGPSLRLVDAARAWSRRALDFDLATVMTHETSLAALAALLQAAAGPRLRRIVEESDRHGVQVCTSLSAGVLDALTAILTALDRGRGPRATQPDREVFEQAITIVYRVLFLLFAEARQLVPTWHHVYREGYTIEALCRRFTRQPERRGLWRAFQAIARLAHAGCRAGDLVVTPFNGRLFSPHHTPLAERARVPDAVMGRIVVSLATTPAGGGRRRIAYADLGVEQLGAVYERVLEYEPARRAGRLRLGRTSHDRKATGSFYTPRAITDFLVRRALHPLVEGRSAEELLRLRVLDPAMGSGAFLVGACRYLADAVDRADRGNRPGMNSPAPDGRAGVRRQVAQRCLFGVDINPTAVQLARLSLWLASLSSAVPLTFLDHHLAVGDSLVGASLLDLTSEPCGRRAEQARRNADLPRLPFDAAQQLAAAVLPGRRRLVLEPGDTPAAVRDKERTLGALGAPGSVLANWKRAADLWCASWFWGPDGLSRGVYLDLVASLTGGAASLGTAQRAGLLERLEGLTRERRFFHWELEFPEVFFTPDGERDRSAGFDAVIGNPPWDVLRADSGSGAERERSRARNSGTLRFFRDAKVYRGGRRGHLNRYQLFVERALQLTRPGGRIALILPSGLISDRGSAGVRRAVLDSLEVDRLIGFDNREVIFPIHRDVRFLLLTGTKGPRTERLCGTFGHSDAGWLERLPDAACDDPPDARRIVLSRTLIESLDPEHLAIPWLSRADDADVLTTITARVPRLDEASGWNVRFGRELNATDDRPHFVDRHAARPADVLTVIEGKHLEPFRVRQDAARQAIPLTRAAALVDAARTYGRSRLAYRDVASATNRVTLIAAILPAGTISTHTVFCAKTRLAADAQYCLLALLNSLVANYLVRLQVTTHVTCALMARLPVPRPAPNSAELGELADLARSLERTGVPGHNPAFARLNALAASLYGLTSAQYEHVLSTFPLLPRDLIALAAREFRYCGRGAGPLA